MFSNNSDLTNLTENKETRVLSKEDRNEVKKVDRIEKISKDNREDISEENKEINFDKISPIEEDLTKNNNLYSNYVSKTNNLIKTIWQNKLK